MIENTEQKFLKAALEMQIFGLRVKAVADFPVLAS